MEPFHGDVLRAVLPRDEPQRCRRRHECACSGIRRDRRHAGLSHANAERDADFAEALFWDLLGRLARLDPGFAGGRRAKGLLRRFKVRIHAVDSTTISLVAKRRDWAAHRARKAAAKLHLGLDMHSFLPTVAVV